MKKMLAIAIATAFAAPAMADTTLYGKLHNSIDITDTGAANAGTTTSLSGNSSRIGVKGSEKISDNLDVVYLVEWGLRSDENGGGLGDRNRYLGLKGNWGSLLTGRIDTPNKGVGRIAEQFGDQLGDARAITNLGGLPDARANNVVAYVSPKMGGFQATLAQVLEDGGNQGQGFSGNAVYNAGNLKAGLGYSSVDGAGDTMRVAAKYKFGAGNVSALVQQDSDLLGISGADRDVWGIGGAINTGSGAVKLQHYVAGDIGSLTDTGGALTTVGYEHKLSKRTALYAQYAQVDNDANAGYGLNSNGNGENVNPVALGDDPSGVSLGMIHNF
jgi:predicted porin